MSFVLGVDGGNTKTIALIAGIDGTIIGAGRGACSDIYATALVDGRLAEADRAVAAACAAAGVAPTALEYAAFSIAGADWAEDFDDIRAAVSGYGSAVTIVNDAVGALRAGTAAGIGVAVVCGTGTATAARNEAGQLWHSSFWQQPQGADELGKKTLWAVYNAALGIGPATALSEAVLTFYDCATAEDVLHATTARRGRRPLPPPRTLARILLDTAAAGDPCARQIVESHGAALGDVALAAARHVGLDGASWTLALAGGVLRHPSRLLRTALVKRAQELNPHVVAVDSRFEPAVGALLLAFETGGIAVDEQLLARIEATLPPHSLFAT